jgi:hypothetical protein
LAHTAAILGITKVPVEYELMSDFMSAIAWLSVAVQIMAPPSPLKLPPLSVVAMLLAEFGQVGAALYSHGSSHWYFAEEEGGGACVARPTHGINHAHQAV